MQVGGQPWPSFAAEVGLVAQRSSAGALAFYTATETVAPLGHRACGKLVVWVKNVLLWGDAHAGASCRVQLGAPPRPGHRAVLAACEVVGGVGEDAAGRS